MGYGGREVALVAIGARWGCRENLKTQRARRGRRARRKAGATLRSGWQGWGGGREPIYGLVYWWF